MAASLVMPDEVASADPVSQPLSDPSGSAIANAVDDRGLFAGRYRIDSVLGTGGMGIVYAATHAELGLPVAIKVIHPSLMDSLEARARFNVEARALAALRSPHALRVLDAGQLGTNRCFLVTERLEGMSLAALLEANGSLPVETAVDYVLQACAALSEAHQLGLVHRDIKPENLFLAQFRNSTSLVKLMDFGIARWIGEGARSGRITNPRSSLGSPCYQSPEQMENALEVDERSDIWSLGLVLYELITDCCPFEADTIQETCWKVLQGPRPSLAVARPGIEPGLAAVVDRCLTRDRSKRFGSMRQLASALRPFATQPQPAPADSRALRRTSRTTSGVDSRRMRVPRMRASLLALCGGVVFGMSAMALLYPEPSAVRHMVQSTSRAALAQAGSALQSIVSLAATHAPEQN